MLCSRIPSKVKPMAKAQISTNKGSMEKIMEPFHVSIFAEDHSDLSESIIMEKVCFDK